MAVVLGVFAGAGVIASHISLGTSDSHRLGRMLIPMTVVPSGTSC